MPKSLREILEKADELADRFESHDPQPDQVVEADSLLLVQEAFMKRAEAERHLADAVAAARADGHSWAAIGAMLGTSGEASRQKYGHPATAREPSR